MKSSFSDSEEIAQLREENARLRKALRQLLEYTGGSELVEKNPRHPIAKAWKVLISS